MQKKKNKSLLETDSTEPTSAVLMFFLSMESLWLLAHSSLPLYEEIYFKKKYWTHSCHEDL